MANSFTIDVDTTALKESLLTLNQALKPFIKVAAKISADNIARDAKDRLQRQLSGTSSGETVAGIVVRADRTGWGWIVDAGNKSTPMLDRWLEKGTQHMHARPFFWASAKLEQAAHASRIRGAVVAGLSEHGLGDAR
jgi:hypothetical protein